MLLPLCVLKHCSCCLWVAKRNVTVGVVVWSYNYSPAVLRQTGHNDWDHTHTHTHPLTNHLGSCLPKPLSWSQRTPLCALHRCEHKPAWRPLPWATLTCRWPLGPLSESHGVLECSLSGMWSPAAPWGEIIDIPYAQVWNRYQSLCVYKYTVIFICGSCDLV